MKFSVKHVAAIGLAMAMVLGQSVVALAEEDSKPIEKVRLDVNLDISKSDMNISLYPTSSHYRVSDYEITNEDDMYETKNDEEVISKNWSPEITLYLEADDGYYFKSNSKSYFEFTGSVAEFVSAKRDSDKTSMELNLILRGAKGSVGNASNLSWDSYGVASWTKGYDAKSFDIELYRDGNRVTSKSGLKNTKYNFMDNITKTGDYTFKVKCKNGSKSSGTVESGTFTVNEDKLKEIKKRAKGNTGYKNENTNTSNNDNSNIANGPGLGNQYGWIQDNKGWWYRDTNNTFPKNMWRQINGTWYRFNGDGYMVTGWWQDGPSGEWYYLNPTSGAMEKGWQTIDNKSYFFYDSGNMAKNGWIWIGDKCYLFRDSGDVYKNCKTPDGFNVDESGAWIH